MMVRLISLFLCTSPLFAGVTETFPQKTWHKVSPDEVGLDAKRLNTYAQRVKGAGVIIRKGHLAFEWGNVSKNRDWASAAKPMLSTMLLLAAQNGLVTSVNAPVSDFGWPMRGKDKGITLHHLVNMTSGYSLAEAPGAAWAYNDVGIQLLAKSLERAFDSSLDQAAHQYLAPLRFEDGAVFGSRRGLGVILSPRDMARVGLLWLNEGKWEKTKLFSNKLFVRNIRPQVAADRPRSATHGDDYLGVGSYGGGTNQTAHGPGIYGFTFWFNEPLPSGQRVWPAAPRDAFQANGCWNRDTVTIFPSLKMVVVVSMAKKPGKFNPGEKGGIADRNMKLLMDAVLTERPKTR